MLLITPSQAEYSAIEIPLRDYLAAGGIEVVMSGMGLNCAATLCRQLEARARLPEILALVGVAGGLDPSLAAGDVVIASEACDEEGRSAPCTVIPMTGAAVGLVLTVRKALYTLTEKSAARDTGAVAVEMEAYPLAAWAAERGLPFLHVRVILDRYDEALPNLGDALDPFGRARPAHLLRRLLAQPSEVVPLYRLLRRMEIISRALGGVAQAVARARQQP
jgi:adenosylhomocysteine nucleosidase